MRFIKVQDNIINFERVSRFFASDYTLVIETDTREYKFSYTTDGGAQFALANILDKIKQYNGCYMGQVS